MERYNSHMKRLIKRHNAIIKRQHIIIKRQRATVKLRHTIIIKRQNSNLCNRELQFNTVILERGYLMGFFTMLYDCIDELLYNQKVSSQTQKEQMEDTRVERQRVEKAEKEIRTKEWYNIKDQVYSRYQLPIADDAKNIAKDLFGKDLDTISTFFITDERVVRQRYIEGGYKAINEYAKNLTEHAFIGGPITATLLRRLKLLEDAKREGKVIDTDMDIDGFVPHAGIKYAIDEIELDGQIIPARRKFSIRCEMTATITEGFRIGPFVLYDGLYLSTKEEMEQITDKDEDIKTNMYGSKMPLNDKMLSENKERTYASSGEKYGKNKQIEVCPHGTDRILYCNQCQGDIIVSPSKKKVIGICLDVSGSMIGMKLSNAKKAVIKVLENIPVNSNIDVVLIIFSTDLRIGYCEDIIPFGAEYTELIRHMAIERIEDIISGGSTPLYDTINYFLDRIWSGVWSGSEGRIFFPYTYLIIVSDGEENQSTLNSLIYKGKVGKDAFFAKLNAYREAGIITEIIPFAYGDDGVNIKLIRELRNISGKKSINEIYPGNIIESLISNVDSILYGADNLKMMGLSIGDKDKN